MKRYIVLSVNDNQDYLYFSPLTCDTWRKMGWEPIVFYNNTGNLSHELQRLAWQRCNPTIPFQFINPIDGYRSDTLTQMSRLYAACLDLQPDDYLMTCDIDMIPLSNYWQPDYNKVTVWGHDLTEFRHFPICYIGAPVKLWREIMKIEGDDYQYYMQRDLMTLPQAKDPDFYKYWYTDQDLITQRLKDYGTGKIDFINRGRSIKGFARGRVDKGHGGWNFDQPELIDAHLLQQVHHTDEKIQKLMDLLHHVWPNEDWLWFLKYTNEFKKLAKK